MIIAFSWYFLQVMEEEINFRNVCHFHETSRLYGLSEVEKSCVKWLESNIMLRTKEASFLAQIKPKLMSQIVRSPDLFVLQVEMDVYTLLKKWLFLQLDPNHRTVDEKNLSATASKFFQDKFKATGKAFLDAEEGAPYVEAFQALRLCNVIGEFGCCAEVTIESFVFFPLQGFAKDAWFTPTIC